MLIDRESDVAVWRQIADDLQSDIAARSLLPGDKLPSESTLAEHYSVNRHTVRRALLVLAQEGYVESARGSGTFVLERPVAYPLTSRTRFSEIMSAQNYEPGGRMISSAVEAANARVAERLECARGEPVFRLESMRVADGVPIVVNTSYFKKSQVPALVSDYAELGSFSKALARAGFGDYRRKSSWITAMAANSADAANLMVKPGTPVLHVESLNVTNDGRPVQFALARFRADAVQLIVESEEN